MAFPQVASSSSGNSGGDNTSHALTLPSSIASGNLLIAVIHCDGANTDGSIDGWQNTLHQTLAGATLVMWREADGTEGGTATLELNDSESIAYVVYRITGWWIAFDAANTAFSDGNTSAPDPPSFAPSDGAGNILWIAATGWRNDVALSSYPASYASNQLTSRWANADGVGVAAATRELSGSSTDPGTFGIASTESWHGITLAVYGTPTATTGWFGPDTGCNCGCEPGLCLECDTAPPGEYLSVSVAGPSNADCDGCVTLRSGTFVVRNVLAPEFCFQEGCCQWHRYLAWYWCYYESGGADVYFGVRAELRGVNPDSIGVEITGDVGSGFLVTVWITANYYNHLNPLINQSFHRSKFQTTVASCADLIGLVVPFVSSDSYEYYPTPGPGDYCGMDGATVTILG